MHMHANRANFAGPPPLPYCIHVSEWPAATTADEWLQMVRSTKWCKHLIMSQTTDEDVMNKALAIMRTRNVYGVINGSLTDQWKAAAPERFISSLIHRSTVDDPPVDSIRKWFRSGRYTVLGELHAQYQGIAANDPLLEPYWAVAEELNMPVGIHIGPSAMGAPYIWPKYKASLHNPLLLEDVLRKHPKLRVYIMHAAWPMIDELLALMWNYPQVYVDISGIISDLPETAFYNYLNKIMEVGLGKRVMFGSDQMIWPELIEIGIQTIEKATSLTTQQKRDILYNNAARFLQLSKEEIARHHAK